MREIKVRGFDKTLQQWVVGYLCGDYIIDINDFEIIYENIDFTSIGQYTCLKDKNDKEIYEGDIVKGNTKHEFLDNIYFHKGIVDFKNGCFVALGEDDNYHILSELSDLEIIGNIYKNKE